MKDNIFSFKEYKDLTIESINIYGNLDYKGRLLEEIDVCVVITKNDNDFVKDITSSMLGDSTIEIVTANENKKVHIVGVERSFSAYTPIKDTLTIKMVSV